MSQRALALRKLSVALAVVLSGAALLLSGPEARAFPGTLNAWQARYGAVSASGDNARCQLCHADANGGSPWNAYGWDILVSLADPACDLDGSGVVSDEEAFFCIEAVDSDGETNDNITEIGVDAQPGWTQGNVNILYTRSGTIVNQPAPTNIGTLDPDGSQPPPPVLPPPPGTDDDIPPGQITRDTIVVMPGQSIQAALDRAEPYTRIYVLAGTYRELGDPTNALQITKNGIRLIGQSNPRKRVVIENAGNQRNGLVVVPPAQTECMSCHSTMGPPFSLNPGVQPGLPDPEPLLHDIEVRGITIRGFNNNGLFTERVDGFKIIDVESIDNRNYGIFPTLSRNGIITQSKAFGSDLDSGIWVETSENVEVTHNLVAGNVNGFEVSNSDNVVLAHNEARDNTVGAAILLLPDIFDDRPGATRIHLRHNWFHDNNKPNTARPGSILSFVPPGIGALYLGVDESEIEGNRVENHDFAGIAIADYCVTVAGTPFACGVDPTTTLEFLMDQDARNNRVVGNTMINNGNNPDPGSDFAIAASDFPLLSFSPTNCYEDNVFTSFFSLVGILPACAP